MSEPTAAAMRAANETCRLLYPQIGPTVAGLIADIIDRETALPELIEACERAERRIVHLLADSCKPKDDPTIVKLRAALAKAQKGTS